MSKKFHPFCAVLFWVLFSLPFCAFGEDVSGRLEAANQSFEQQQYTQALEQYEALYAEEVFTERMLYRLAFMHENLKNYPEAIYYLKKADQEYGNPDSESKIKQMMQMNGSSRVFTEDSWGTYFLFYNRYGTYIWIAFGLLSAALAVALIFPARKPHNLRTVAVVSGWVLFALFGIFFIRHFFLSPHRAVLMEKTSFYDFPSYAGHSVSNAFSLGETLDITGREDIWARVEAGGQEYWVPARVLRDL